MQKQYKLKDLIENFILLTLAMVATVLGVLFLTGSITLRKDVVVSPNVVGFILLFLGVVCLLTSARVIILYYSQKTKEK